MSKCDIRFFREKSLEWNDGGGEIIFVEVGLSFIEEIVEGIAKLLRFGLRGFIGRVLRVQSKWDWKCSEGRGGMRNENCGGGHDHETERVDAMKRLHGSLGGCFPASAFAGETPGVLDAPLEGRFAWPLLLPEPLPRTRAR